jgi:hypothetical protein
MNRTARRLLSGTSLLRDTARPDTSFGSVSGETRPEGDGLVHAILDASAYRARFLGGLSISMTEPAATTLAKALTETAARLEHLRALSRLGALQPDFGASPEATWSESPMSLTAGKELTGVVDLPEPLAEPRFDLTSSVGRVTYAAADSTTVRLTFQDVVAVVQTGGAERTVVGRAADRTWLTLISDRLDTEVSGAEQFSFQSPQLGWDVIAAGLTIDTASTDLGGD